MMQTFRALLITTIMLGILLQWHDLEAQSWGVTVGLSRALKNEWSTGLRATTTAYWKVKRHVECGCEAAANFWRPASRPPFGMIGVGWVSSGAAWLFEMGPSIRFTTRPLDESGASFIWYGGSGLVIISSDAELFSYVPGYPKRTRLDLVDSRAAPYIQMGISALSAGNRGLRGELSAGARLLFVKPELTGVVTMELGITF